MTSATTFRSWFSALLLASVFVLGTTGCPSNPSEPGEDTATPDIIGDGKIPIDQLDELVGGDTDTEIEPDVLPDLDVPSPDVPPECPETKCQIGKLSCPTPKFEQICVPYDEDLCPNVGTWSQAEACPANSSCVANQGCLCNMGTCEEDDITGCIAPQDLASCEEWACLEGCCAIVAIPDCCATAAECNDGDPCTQDLCDMQAHACMHTALEDTGLCDDGDPCTQEGCDPATGDCTYTLNTALPGCSEIDCWGSTQDLANDNFCNIDPCIVPTCTFDAGFLSWDEAYAPDCVANPEYCGKCDVSVETDCDDSDPCTEDSCVPGVGCVHELKLNDPACFCIDTNDCLQLIDGNCQEVACLVSQHVCVKSPKDCEDGHMCTFDFCDQQTNTCVHQLIEPTPPECLEIELCYGDDFCDDQVTEEFGENCACKNTWCEFVTGKDYGFCEIMDVGCDDNNPCTIDSCGSDGDTCACAYDPIDCEDGDPCTGDTCDPILGCLHPPLDVDDGNPCTIDTCDPDAALLGYAIHTSVICEEKACMVGICNVDNGLCNYTWDSCDDGNPCTVDSCDEGTGDCIHGPYICNDNNPCTIDFCTPDPENPSKPLCEGNEVSCSDGNLCTEDVCNQVTGTCMHPPVYCNDQNACTLDTCDPVQGCISNEAMDCTDCVHPITEEVVLCPGGNGPPGFEINNCTEDLCDPISGCYNVPVVNLAAGCGGCLSEGGGLDHTVCDDNNLCTLDQCLCTSWNPANPTECVAAECQSTAKECDCPGDCAVCSCDPYTGECQAVAGNCSDCINPETGITVLCPNVVPPGFVKNLCTLDSCNMDTGACAHTAVNCFDNNLCTEDVCNPVAGCTYPAMDCDDGMPCTVDTCSPGAGCLYQEECDDGDLCTVDACMTEEPYECQFISVDCDDDNPCTVDICGNGGICIYQPMACEDSDPCTIDVCDPDFGDPDDDFCLHAPKACNDNDPCTVDICHPLNGSCYFQEISCDDCINPSTSAQEECPGMAPEGFVKNLCTEDFASQDGEECVCNHTEVNPADQNLCTTDICDPAIGVVNEPMVCVDDGDPCTIETCNPLSGLCSATLMACDDDGDPCTENVPEAIDDPELGLICGCVANPLNCDDSNACTIDTTIIEAGVCSCDHEAVVCDDDNDPCTTDICKIDEGCVNIPPECEDGDVCTYDWCNPSLAEISDDPDVYCVHEEKSCQDCMNPETGQVIENCVELPEGFVYNECTQGDYCDLALGGCQYPQVTQCPSDQDLCTLEYCDPTTGQCASDELDCDDGNLCTVDQCVDGQCVKSDAPGAQCTGPADCDDDDPCTQDLCATTGNCTCSNPPVDCDDGDCCTVDVCDADEGECTHTPIYPGCALCVEDMDCMVECPTNPFTGIQVEPDDPESGLCDPNTAIIIDDENTVVVFRDACNQWVCDLDGGQDCGEGIGQCMNVVADCDDEDECTLDYCDPEIGCYTEQNPSCCTPLTDPPLMEDSPNWDPQISVCFDADPCTVDSCNYDTGACMYQDLVCDDGNVCTVDLCDAQDGCTFNWQQGCEYVCYNDYDCSAVAGNGNDTLGLCSADLCTFTVDALGNCVYDEVVCNGGMACTEGICDPEGGCSYKPLGAGCDDACQVDDDCDDGWACSNAVCDDGTCLVTVTPCTDEDPCTRDFCDPNTGFCTTAALDDCATDDCVVGGGDAWCDDGDACTIDWCDMGMHQCMYSLKTCDDGDLCTTDVCDPAEGCLFFPSVPCLSCYGDGDCDDGNPCTEDVCKTANPVQFSDDGYMGNGKGHPDRYCSHKSICAECESQVDCDAYDLDHPCADEAVCDTETGLCEIEFVVCDDGDPCTADECNPYTGDCAYTEIPDCCDADEQCGEMAPCYTPYCDPGSHMCLSLPSLCDDFNPCTLDSCDAETGCAHEALPGCFNECEKAQDCYAIGFGPASCTIAECSLDEGTGDGTCLGVPLTCDDGNPCTDDACIPLLGCQSYLSSPDCTFECAVDVNCDDGNPCTEEVCNPLTKMCEYSLPICDDQDECTTDWCDPATGDCVNAECPDCDCDEGCTQNSACNDGNPCTLDLCNDGACSHPTLTCVDGDPCTNDTCDPVDGCLFAPIPSCAGCTSPASCDDGNLCTEDLCVNQYCISMDLCAQ